MRIQCTEDGQTCVMTITGDFCAEDVDPFRMAANERLRRDIRDFVVELREVEFVDSKALESLLWLVEVCEEKLGQVRLAALQENVQTVLQMTRLMGRFSCHPDIDAAINSLR